MHFGGNRYEVRGTVGLGHHFQKKGLYSIEQSIDQIRFNLVVCHVLQFVIIQIICL